MPNDIRSFFSPRGEGGSQASKQTTRRSYESKGRRGSEYLTNSTRAPKLEPDKRAESRKVVDESDEEDYIESIPKPVAKKQRKP